MSQFMSGGSGIRTHGGLHLTAFQEPRICPLCHPSGAARVVPARRVPRLEACRPRDAHSDLGPEPLHPRVASRIASSTSRRIAGPAGPGRGVGAEELDSGQPGVQVAEAVGDDLVGDVTLEVDDEAVVAERLLRRARLELGQVDVPRRELAEDRVEAARDGLRSGSRRCWCGRDRSARGSPTGPARRSGSGSRGGPRRPLGRISRP